MSDFSTGQHCVTSILQLKDGFSSDLKITETCVLVIYAVLAPRSSIIVHD